MKTIEAFNELLFLMINGTPTTPGWLVGTALVLADYLIWIIPLILVVMWLSGDDRQREVAIRSCCVTLLALGANQVIGFIWQHPRPFMIGLGHTFLQHAPDSSFPSDHATVFSSIALTALFGRMWRTGCMVLVTGIAVAWARVFLGVHFPLDMIGAVAVSCVAYVIIMPLRKAAGPAVTQLAIA